MTLVALDLDHFKDINDTLGHDAGDTALRRVGLLLRQRLRRVDKVFRVGGEEFLALLWNTDAQGRPIDRGGNPSQLRVELTPAQSTDNYQYWSGYP